MKALRVLIVAIALSLTLTPAIVSAQQATDAQIAQAASPATTEVKPPAIDPKVLLGEWAGKWAGGGSGGNYYLTGEKFDGEKMICSLLIQNTRQRPNEDCVATINGNQVEVTASSRKASLNFGREGKYYTLTGAGTGTVPYEIKLYKKI